MTCIVAIKTPENQIIMAADSSNNDGNDAYTIIKGQKKIFKVNNMLIGVAGFARVAQILNYDFEFPEDNEEDPYLYLIKKFIPSFKSRMETEKIDKDGNYASDLLIGYKNRVFRIDGIYGIVEAAEDYDAIGCARHEARGALFALKYSKLTLFSKCAEIAVSAAINADVNIKPPIHKEIL